MNLLNFRPKRPGRQPVKTPTAPTEGPDSSSRATGAPTTPAGWLDSSAELKGGLQVQEDDLDAIPPEFRDAFESR